MGITRGSSLREVAFAVCTALDRVGVTAVLTGGGAATLYAPEAIQSFDLDFVLEVYSDKNSPGKVLEELGFRREGHDYRHRASRFQLEFPVGPLAIGAERIERWSTLRAGPGLLHVITATDSCRDRLAAFFHFQDRSALDQACAVYAAQKRRIVLKKVRAWSQREGKLDAFEEFARRVRP
ncbi:MAG: hypothetical protein HOP15_10240 [Planctomycetes bacterium]|nr:hypothetical protein [Planctomycetota bacterium]